MKKYLPFTLFLVWAIVQSGLPTAGISSEIRVSTYAELKEKFDNNAPGDLFILEAGTYSGEPLRLEGNGTAEQPIRIQAAHLHQAKIDTELQLIGNYLSLEDCQFVGEGHLIIEGTGIRISRCLINDSKAKKWVRVLPGSMQIEIDHNRFENKTSNIGNRSCQLLQVVVLNQNERHHIHHNLFKDIPKGTENNGNGYETLQLITKGNPFNPPPGDCNSIIEYNLFVRANGESEIISVKSNGNLIRNNTFRACRGGLVLRHGHGNIATANVMLAEGEPKASGIRIQGRNQIVANNYFEGLGGYGIGMMDGTPDDLYVRVEQGLLAFNTFVNCKKVLEIGLNHSKHPNGTPPKDCRIIGNLYYTSPDFQEDNLHPIVVLVQGDEPENFVWKGNVAFGKQMEDFSGIRNLDPQLIFTDEGLAVPSAQTPKIKHRIKVDQRFYQDLSGTTWKKKRSVGAMQYAPNQFPFFLTEDMVGPKAG